MINANITHTLTGLSVLILSAFVVNSVAAQVDSTRPEIIPQLQDPIEYIVVNSQGSLAEGALVFSTHRQTEGIKVIGASARPDGSLVFDDDPKQVRTDERGQFLRVPGKAYFFASKDGTEFAFAPPEYSGQIRLRPGGKLKVDSKQYINFDQGVRIDVRWTNCLAGSFPRIPPAKSQHLDWRLFRFFDLAIVAQPGAWNLEKPLEIVVPPGEISATSITESQLNQLNEFASSVRERDKTQIQMALTNGRAPVMGIHTINAGETTTIPLKFGVCLSGKIKEGNKRSSLPEWSGPELQNGSLGLLAQRRPLDSTVRTVWLGNGKHWVLNGLQTLQSAEGKRYRERAPMTFVAVNDAGEFLSLPLPSDNYHTSFNLGSNTDNSQDSKANASLLLSPSLKPGETKYSIKVLEYGTTDRDAGSDASDVKPVGRMDVGTLFYLLDNRVTKDINSPAINPSSTQQFNRNPSRTYDHLPAPMNMEESAKTNLASSESASVNAIVKKLKTIEADTNEYSNAVGELARELMEEFAHGVRKREAELEELEQLLLKTRRAVSEREKNCRSIVDRQVLEVLQEHGLPSRVMHSRPAQPRSLTQPPPINSPSNNSNEYLIKLQPIVAKFADSGERYGNLSARLVFAKDDAKIAADWFVKNSPRVHIQIQDSLSRLRCQTVAEMKELVAKFDDEKAEIEKAFSKNAGIDIELRVFGLSVQ